MGSVTKSGTRDAPRYYAQYFDLGDKRRMKLLRGVRSVEAARKMMAATRHTFVTRSLEAGASLDDVSAAVGHSSPVVTKPYYDHFVRRSFSAQLRTGLPKVNRKTQDD
jgi:integrase